MRKTLRLLILGSLPLLLVITIMFCLSVLRVDFKYAHQSYATYQNSFDWFSYKIKTKITKSFITFKKNNKIGLPIKSIYLKEAFQKELLKNTPESTKKWKEGFFANEDGTIEKIEVRLKGDNPSNWLFLKKNWKIKKKKKKITNRQRHFEYLPFKFSDFLSGKIANSLGLASPNFNLVELFINDQSEGVYTESEVLNEGFLRRNKIMPVNIYKGEMILAEAIIGLESNLLNSPGALKKIAYFNQIEIDDKSDIIFLSKVLQLAHNNEESYLQLLELIDLNDWSKFASYQILTQNFHNDYSHNFRLISDPWSGKYTPIVYDPIFNIDIQKQNIEYDHSSNEIFLLLNQNSTFQNLKFEYLNFLLDSNILDKEINDITLLEEKIKISEGRDVEILSKNLNIFELFLRILNNKKNLDITTQNRKIFINKFLTRKQNIRDFLNSKPDASWYKNDNGFEIHLNGKIPLSDLNLLFENKKTNWVVLDINENGKIDKNELKFYLDDNKKLLIPYRFYANRIPYASNATNLSSPKIKTLPTRFKFISENKVAPSEIKYQNPFSKENYDLKYKNQSSFPLSKFNNPIHSHKKDVDNKTGNRIILEGENYIKETVIYNDVVEIKPGTIFNIKNGKSIIFKNKLIALGSLEKPIIFKKKDDKEWGTVALQGDYTNNSKLNHIIFDGGSGDFINNIKYTGALSIHDTKNISLKNIMMKNNSNYDDMLHVVYVDNIILEKIFIENSIMDAIDIDMSHNVIINNIEIKQSGNDGIDLMETDAIISNAKIYNSNDKAISVGENSFLILNNSQLLKNNIAVATKDKSFSFIINSNIVKNNISINNYKKNWQYGEGGITRVHKSKLYSNQNLLVDKYSTVKITNSDINNIILEERLIQNKKKHSLILEMNEYDVISKKLKINSMYIVDKDNHIGVKK